MNKIKIQKRKSQLFKQLGTEDKKYSYSSILFDESSSKDFFIHNEIIGTGVQTSAPHYHQETEEFIYVLKGTVIAHEGNKTASLSAGDSVLFHANSMVTHFIENVSNEIAEVLVVKKNVTGNDVIYSKKVKKKVFDLKATTTELLYVCKVKNAVGKEKIIQITHSSRLFKLAQFIFHIFDVNLEDSEFEFSYTREGAKSYGDYLAFRLPKADIPFPQGIGNIRNARIDSVFFPFDADIVLKVNNLSSDKFIIKFLGHEEPNPRRKYPYEVKLKDIKP